MHRLDGNSVPVEATPPCWGNALPRTVAVITTLVGVVGMGLAVAAEWSRTVRGQWNWSLSPGFILIISAACTALGALAYVIFRRDEVNEVREPQRVEADLKENGSNRVYIASNPIFKDHITGAGHPETSARVDAIDKALKREGLCGNPLTLRSATIDEISSCHPKDYIALVKSECESLGRGLVAPLSTGDVNISRDSYKTALLAAGTVLNAVDKVIAEPGKRAFCSVRPPGHHAGGQNAVLGMDEGRGFCLFNSVAIAARYAQIKHNIERVLIVDWDVHHGDGTQNIFYSDKSVFYFSTHNMDPSPKFYPGTGNRGEIGKGEGVGHTLNCPFFTDDHNNPPRKAVIAAFKNGLVEAMKEFKPQLVLISAGFDAHEKDPLGGADLKDEDFAELTHIVCGIADKYAQGRVVSVLEGGYSLEALDSAVVAHVKALNQA